MQVQQNVDDCKGNKENSMTFYLFRLEILKKMKNFGILQVTYTCNKG